MVDVLCERRPQPGERLHGRTVLRAGGSAVNAAVAAAEAGADASVFGRIGSDVAGDLVVASLAARGVTDHLARDAMLPTGVAVAFDDAVVADRGANAALSPDDVPERLEADALLVSGFALFQTGSAEAARAALDRYRGEWAGVDLGSPRLAGDAELTFSANVLFATAEEAYAVTGADPEAAARELATQFEIVCVKLGADGALAVRGAQVERAAARPVVRASWFGAGDAFAAAFLVALAGGDDLREALSRGGSAAAEVPSAT
jgi:ribokinase